MMTDKGSIEFQSLDKEYGVRISLENMSCIEELCSKALPNETGGILIGQYSDDCRWAEISIVTKPPVGSVQLRRSFTRAGKTLLPVLDSLWEKNQYYVGEWHFHPYLQPYPSKTDLQTMYKLSRNKQLHCPEPILIIVGGEPSVWTYHVSIFMGDNQIILFKT